MQPLLSIITAPVSAGSLSVSTAPMMKRQSHKNPSNTTAPGTYGSVLSPVVYFLTLHLIHTFLNMNYEFTLLFNTSRTNFQYVHAAPTLYSSLQLTDGKDRH